ncbi:chemoreceptor glutamine deamidase CheD [Granulosicoccaceae sp. 1_MG-2023]|nr:chemoreceptor glutamine deamidase CheD [Granulosicoccaceae sp. 1_MG-2023]
MAPLAVQSTIPERPEVMPQFRSVKSYWDAQHGRHTVRILPGEYYVSTGDEIITTLLGSCVSACIRDPQTGMGGMNHFLLPESCDDRAVVGSRARYGTYAMEHLINVLLANGGRRERLEVKLFGGSRIMKNATDVGERNIAFIRDYLRTENIPVLKEDLGGTHPRKVLYFAASGRVLIKKLPLSENTQISELESSYEQAIIKKPVAGDVDLF